jgi:acyl transferase domain-containing protein
LRFEFPANKIFQAINAIYVKRLSDAVRDGNPIQAVIRATASNCDGRTPGISHPSLESHEALMRAAYTAAGLENHAEMGFVECHGTGTSIGMSPFRLFIWLY